MTSVTFFVPGTPVGQGNHRTSASGHVYETTKGHKAWRDRVILFARMAAGRPLTGPVRVDAGFTFPRPKSHYRTGKFSRLLKESAPAWHSIKPDADHLARCCGDALTAAGVLKDDAQIASWKITKWYGERPGMTVTVTTLEVS